MQRSEDEEGSHVTRVTTGNPRWLDVILLNSYHSNYIIYIIIYIYFLLEKSNDVDCYFGWLEGNEESTPKCSIA